MNPKPIRLQTYLSRAGVASRRASEELIRDGRVLVNGEPAEIGASVVPGEDVVQVDGRVIRVQTVEWIALHKPKGYVSTRDDPRGRKTIYDLIPAELHHLFHVGRLDRDSSGLLLLTNDGEGANRLLHPRYETTKEYLVDIDREPSSDELRSLVTGIELEDGPAHAESAEFQDEIKPGVFRLRIVMREGRNREVRRMMEALGHDVRRLFRRRFGPVEIGRLGPGEWRRLTADELQRIGRGGGSTPARRGRPGAGRGGPGTGTGRGGRGPGRRDDRSGPPPRGKRGPGGPKGGRSGRGPRRPRDS